MVLTDKFYALENITAWLILDERGIILHQSTKWLASSSQIGYKATNIRQSFLQNFKLMKIARLKHLPNCINFWLVNFNTIMSYNKPKNLSEKTSKAHFNGFIFSWNRRNLSNTWRRSVIWPTLFFNITNFFLWLHH